MDPVAGKVAFVTGGASGIGLGLSKVLVKAGMKVVIADVREDHLADAAEYFAQGGQKQSVLTLRLDVTDRAAYRAGRRRKRCAPSARFTCWSTTRAWDFLARSNWRNLMTGTGASA